MPRTIDHRSKHANCAKWRDAVGVTERQAEVVVALMAAQTIGRAGATTEELAEIGVNRKSAYRASELERMRMIELVGHTDEKHPRKIWRATPLAFQRFGVAMPRPVPVEVETVEGRAELMAERMAERKKRQQRARYHRMKESA